MANKFVFYWILNFIAITHINAQLIEKNEVTIGIGYGNNIFESPNDSSYPNKLIQNDFYYVLENEFEVSKKIKQFKHHFSLKTNWYTFTNYKILNTNNIKFQYALKHHLSKKLKFYLKTNYVKNKAHRTNIFGERLRRANHYQTFSVNPQLNFTINSNYKFKLTYFYTSYFYFKDNADYNYHKNRWNAEATIHLKHLGHTEKKLKFLLDISNRNYLHKISKNRLGKRLDDNALWNWTYYTASINFFEAVDYHRNMRIAYDFQFKEDNFEGYYNFIQQNILLDYSYMINQSNSLMLTTNIGFRKYIHRALPNKQPLRYFYPEVGIQYHCNLKEQFKFKTIVQTNSRSVNFKNDKSLSNKNYFSLFIETSLSYNFANKG